jgi:hypothetical protein
MSSREQNLDVPFAPDCGLGSLDNATWRALLAMRMREKDAAL